MPKWIFKTGSVKMSHIIIEPGMIIGMAYFPTKFKPDLTIQNLQLFKEKYSIFCDNIMGTWSKIAGIPLELNLSLVCCQEN